MPILELTDIKKSYYLGKETFPVLKGINLSFDRGEFISILGESGGGKSTLMNIIGGLDRNYAGDVIVNGDVQRNKKEKDMDTYRRSTIGFIFQSFNLVSYLSVLDNVLLSLKMTSLSHSQQVAQAEQLLTQVGLIDHKSKKPNQLSGGQKQRVAIARALASDPEIIIADEPTGALDSQNTKEVLAILRQIAENGKTVIVVTHSQEVADYGTRIVRLADGLITRDERIKPAYPVTHGRKSFHSKVLSAGSTFSMAAKHFKNNWKQNFLIALGTGIGLFAVMLFLGLGNGVSKFAESQIGDMLNPTYPSVMRRVTDQDDLPNSDAIMLSQQAMSQGDAKSIFTDEQIKALEQIKHVKSVEKTLTVASLAPIKLEMDGNSQTTTQNVVNSWTNSLSTSTVKTGKAPQKGEIVIDPETAKLFDSKNYKQVIGKTITMTLVVMNEATGQPATSTLSYKISGIGAKELGIVASYDDLHQSLADAGAKIAISALSVQIDDLKNVDATTKKIQNIKLDGHKAFVTAGAGDVLQTVNKYLDIIKYVLAAIAGISLLVSIFMIIVTTYMSVAERTKEIGILRAMGSRKADIRRLFTLESIILGLSSAILATALAYLAQSGLNKALSDIMKFSFVQISISNVIFAIITGIVIALIASIAPSSKAGRMNTIDALSAE